MSQRKPPWLHKLCPKDNLAKLQPTKCEACHHWTLQSRNRTWEDYNPGIITGNDLTTAIILGRALTRITWQTSLNQPLLETVSGTYGLDPHGQYLEYHICGRQPISAAPFVFPENAGTERKWRGPRVSEAEVEEFERIWRMPLPELSGAETNEKGVR